MSLGSYLGNEAIQASAKGLVCGRRTSETVSHHPCEQHHSGTGQKLPTHVTSGEASQRDFDRPAKVGLCHPKRLSATVAQRRLTLLDRYKIVMERLAVR